MSAQVPSYPAFPYCIELTPSSGAKALGGFFQVDGLPRPNSATPVPFRGGIHKVSDVTLKRGVVDSAQLWDWINGARSGGATAGLTVHIILRDETRQPTTQWTLRSTTPKRWTGPTLSGKGGGDVAIEELVLSAESLELTPPK